MVTNTAHCKCIGAYESHVGWGTAIVDSYDCARGHEWAAERAKRTVPPPPHVYTSSEWLYAFPRCIYNSPALLLLLHVTIPLPGSGTFMKKAHGFHTTTFLLYLHKSIPLRLAFYRPTRTRVETSDFLCFKHYSHHFLSASLSSF